MTKSPIYANYDWDDNIMYMPTRIIYFAKDSSNPIKEIAVSTEGFAHSRSTVGVKNHVMNFVKEDNLYVQCDPKTSGSVAIDLIDYHIVYTNDESFREFRDHDTVDFFMNDLKKAIAEKKFGPSFADFQEHCSDALHAKNVKIITARGQSPSTIHKGLVYLKEQGYINFVPELSNIYPVSYKGPELADEFKAAASSPQEAKMKVLAQVLDHMTQNHVGATFGFSDDDKKTFEYTETFIRNEVSKNRWSNIQINLYFTGNKIKERKIMLEVTEFDVA